MMSTAVQAFAREVLADEEPQASAHHEEYMFFSKLLIDLKVQLAGAEPIEPITLERLQQGSEFACRLLACKTEIARK